MCKNQIHTVKAKNAIKIQFTHFNALSYFTDLLITPYEPPFKRIATQYQ